MQARQREFEAVLPIGHTDDQGQIHRHAVLRKMTGHEEALLYDPTINAGRLVTQLIRSCLVRLGDLDQLDSETISRFYVADRSYLLLELRRITLGDQLLTSYQCPRCGGDVQVTEDLSRLEVRRLEPGQTLADIELELEDGYVDRNGTLHTELTLTLPRGADEELVAPLAEKDPFKARDALTLRCIKRFGALPEKELEAYGVKILRDLTMGDRQRLQQALNHATPGVSFARSLRCDQCGAGFEGVLDVTSFFQLS
jgi:hypothetical protein